MEPLAVSQTHLSTLVAIAFRLLSCTIYTMKQLKPCGHRLTDKQFRKIAKFAKKWGVKNAVALRRIIDEYGV